MEKRVLVIGDLMLDKHTVGTVKRISPEAPVPVINADLESRVRLGAAANVAAQLSAANCNTWLAFKCFTPNATDPRDQSGWLAYDEQTENVSKLLDGAAINPFPLFYTGVTGPVTVKERIWTGQQQICRVDYEDTRKPTLDIETVWVRQLKELIEDNDIDCVVFSDYDKGTLTDRLIQSIADFCWDNEMISILDPKRHSYWGLQHLTVIKPNAREVAITHRSPKELSEELGDTYLLNTLSEDGMRLWQNGEHIASERVYSTAEQVVDVCGCGDTTTAFLAIALMEEKTIEQAMKVASLASSVNIRHRGCYVLDHDDMRWVYQFPGGI